MQVAPMGGPVPPHRCRLRQTDGGNPGHPAGLWGVQARPPTLWGSHFLRPGRKVQRPGSPLGSGGVRVWGAAER